MIFDIWMPSPVKIATLLLLNDPGSYSETSLIASTGLIYGSRAVIEAIKTWFPVRKLRLAFCHRFDGNKTTSIVEQIYFGR